MFGRRVFRLEFNFAVRCASVVRLLYLHRFGATMHCINKLAAAKVPTESSTHSSCRQSPMMLPSPTRVQTALATISVHASGRKNGGITVAVVLLMGLGMPPSPPSLLPTGVTGDVEPKLSGRGSSMCVSGASGGHTLGSDGAVCPLSFACNGSTRSGACSARIGLDCSPGRGVLRLGYCRGSMKKIVLVSII